jgi:hypothetical protein
VTPLGVAPKFLIQDRDDKFGTAFNALALATGIRVIRTAFRYFNAARPHQGSASGTPVPAVRPRNGKVGRLPVLCGLHHDYRRAA